MNQNHSAKITISLVTWNSEKDLPIFFDSLEKQTNKKFNVVAIDNNSLDGTINYLQKLKYVDKIIKNNSNRGYTGGHNQGIEAANTPYVMVANPDIKFHSNFIEEALKVIEAEDCIGSVGGKLLKMNSSLNTQENSDIIDSTGLRAYKSRRFVDRGEGEKDAGQYDKTEEVFGVSGALALYRKKALIDIKLKNGQIFDEMYFVYREDIDLAWRLQQRKWKSLYHPGAIAWHRRTAFGNEHKNHQQTIVQRRRKSKMVNSFSYRNHLYTLMKNETCSNLFWWWPWIFIYELKKLLYIIIAEPRTYIKSFDIIRNIREIMHKRSYILSRRTASKNEIRKWFQ